MLATLPLRTAALLPLTGRRLLSAKVGNVKLSGTKELMVTLNNKDSVFHASWLSHNCFCEKCRQESSGQRLARAKDDSTISSAKAVDGGRKLVVEFSKGHTGEFSAEWLDSNRYDLATMNEERSRLAALSKTRPKKGPFRTTFSRATGSKEGTLEWMEAVIDQGVVVVENTPPVEKTLLEFISTTGCDSSHRLYGTTFVVEATANPINVAYSSEALDAHQDLAYYESPPGIQLLHCLEFDSKIEGGNSTFVDGHAAAELLREKHPASFEALCRIPATFQKDHVRRADPAKMFYQRPHILTNNFGDVTAIFWAPPFEGPLRVPPADVETYFKAYADFEAILKSDELWKEYGIEFRLRPGDLVVFNNRRYLHGRAAFKVPLNCEGRRKLHGCYLEMDRFLNRVRVMNWEQKQIEAFQLRSRPGTSDYR